MSKTIGWLFTVAIVFCMTGCGDGGGSVVEEASQSDIEAYEQMIAEEEAQMSADMEGTE